MFSLTLNNCAVVHARLSVMTTRTSKLNISVISLLATCSKAGSDYSNKAVETQVPPTISTNHR